MRKIFIQVGCGSCRELLKVYKDYDGYEIYGIDPSIKYSKNWDDVKIPNLTLINKAAWTYDGEINYYEDWHPDPQGSTLIAGKKGAGDMAKHTVECFDFSNWLKQFKGCYIEIDMDIEGSEYDVIGKMIDDGTIKLVNKLAYENHGHKCYDRGWSGRAFELEKKLKELGIDFSLIGSEK